MVAKNLGEILLEQGIIDRDALDRALQIQSRRLGEILIQEHLADPVAIAQALKFQARARPGRHSARLSVDVATLDAILTRIEQLEDTLSAGSPGEVGVLPALTTLRSSVESLLLEPVDSLFVKARWVAQQASAELGKQVEVICEGGGLVVDRAIVEELSDMILHLVRNAIDHGIENGEQRVAAGKPPGGVIRIGVSVFGGRLALSVSDDGAGVDEDAVYAKASAAGLLQRERAHTSPDELLRMLFTPGFSTRSSASTLSGRGVGLDVVEAAAIRLAGDVTVRSDKGKGASFRITVPLRLARLAIVPLRAGREWVAVSAAEIASVERLSSGGGLLRADALFTPGAVATPAVGPVIKIECLTGSCWSFDEVGPPEDVLVREASAFAKGAHGVIGGARLHDGRAVLLLDLKSLAEIAAPRAPSS